MILGIKWKRFRYRITFQNTPAENVISIRRQSITPTIRENCCEGRYRHSTTEELITSGNDIQPTLRNTSTYNAKLESCKYLLQIPLIKIQLLSRYCKHFYWDNKSVSIPLLLLLLIIIFLLLADRESIFRWPFRNKMKISSSKLVIDENRVLDSNEEAVHRREHDSILAEKNERLRRSIYERLNSTSSMPDLVNDSQPGTYAQKVEDSILNIQKGVESELDENSHYQIVDEIHDTKSVESIPVRVKQNPVKAKSSEKSVQKEPNDTMAKQDQNLIPPKPPARRRSRASDLTHPEEKKDVQEIQITPPVVKPRKRITHLTVKIYEPPNQKDDFSLNEAVLSAEQDEKITLNTDTVDSKHHEDTSLETILSPPTEYKDPSLNMNTVQTEALSPNIDTENLTNKQDSSSNLTTEILKHEQDSGSVDKVDSTEKAVDSSISTNKTIITQDSSLFHESKSTTIEHPTRKDSPSSVKNQITFQDTDSTKTAIVTPKSILKTQQDSSQQPKSTVQFINVPDSSSDDDDYEDSNDVWSKIEIHRQQLIKNHELNRVYISSSSADSPPPLPKTPPPTADIQERNFEFA